MDDLSFIYSIRNLAQIPACMILELRVWIAQELVLQRSADIEAILQDGVYVAQQKPVPFSEVVAFVQLLSHEAEPDELRLPVLVLP